MNLAICTLSSVSVLKSPDLDAPRVYELLFGETLAIIDVRAGWCQVQLPDLEQCGWMMEGQYQQVTAPIETTQIVDENGGYAVAGEDTTIELFYGSPFPEQGVLKTDAANYRILASPKSTDGSFDAERDRQLLEDFVVTYLHAPFAFRGRTKHGLDDIGLCDLFYRQFGITVSNNMETILSLGQPVDFFSEIQDGDLAFFEDKEGRIDHLGIVISEREVLHVVEKVRIDSLDDEGIFNQEKKMSTHKLRIVKRLF